MESHILLIISVLLSLIFFQNSLANECSSGGKNIETKLQISCSGLVSSGQRRNFGGVEPTNYVAALTAVFGVPGWLTQGLEAFSDINFHLLGYTALGKFGSCLIFLICCLNHFLLVSLVLV
jgi:hypothetical protein